MSEIRCNNCHTLMVELEVDYESMTDGQEADYMAGFNHPFMCPKCGAQDLCDTEHCFCDFDEDEDECVDEEYELHKNLPGMRIRQVNSEKINLLPRCKQAKNFIVQGEWNEYLARKYYEAQGFECIKMVQFRGKRWALNAEEVIETCYRYEQPELAKFICAITNFGKDVSGLPDFLVMGYNKSFFVECKGDVSQVRKNQHEAIQRLLRAGIKVEVFCTHVKIDVSWDESNIFDLRLDDGDEPP